MEVVVIESEVKKEEEDRVTESEFEKEEEDMNEVTNLVTDSDDLELTSLEATVLHSKAEEVILTGITVEDDLSLPKSTSCNEVEEAHQADLDSIQGGSVVAGNLEEIDIDLQDPAVEAAATKIQSAFKGYKTRRKLKE